MSSPAAVCPASDSSTNSALGTVSRKCRTPSGLTTSDSFPRISSTGIAQVRGGLLEPLGAQLRVVAGLGHEGRVPVPVPAAVALAQVLLQSLRAARPGPVRQIRGDGVSGLVQRAEPVQAAEHEIADARAAVLLEPRDDVDEHQPGDPARPGPIRDQDAGQSAHARPDQHHRPTDGVEHLHDVIGQRLDVVVGVGRSIAVTVAAAVQCDHVESLVSQHLAGVLPGKPILAAAVQHQDRRPTDRGVGAAIPLVRDQREPLSTGELDSVSSVAQGSHKRLLGRFKGPVAGRFPPDVTAMTFRLREGLSDETLATPTDN